MGIGEGLSENNKIRVVFDVGSLKWNNCHAFDKEKHMGVVALYLRVRLAEGFCGKKKNK